MRVFVTGGGRGFVGRHVVAALERAGHDVCRDWVDVRDREGLVRAIGGCEAVVHVAALYSYTAPPEQLEAVNVEGTSNVIAACRASRVRRVVHTSTAGTCGPVPGRLAGEEDGPPEWELTVPYKRTKLAAERLVLAAAGEHFEAVCVNPTTPIGEGDDVPTPTGRMVRGVASGRYRVTLQGGGLNLVDVHDVARAHVLALERGRSGERYLVGGSNLTLAEVFSLIARAARRPSPRVRIPYAAARAFAAVGLVNRYEVRLARLPAWFSSAKAERELGYNPAPIEAAVERAVGSLPGRLRR
jgi:dihydroflavonol-4-reductase